MIKIVGLLFLQAGILPVLSQFEGPSFSGPEYGDYGGHYISGNTEEASSFERDFPQPSFFSSFDKKDKSFDSVTSVTSASAPGSYGGLVPPPLPSQVRFNEGDSKPYYKVPSSLQELEESYIRSLSATTTKKPIIIPPYDKEEAYSGFLKWRDNNLAHSHEPRSIEHRRRENLRNYQLQNAPITYGLPVLDAPNSINPVPFTAKRKETAFPYKKVPTFPDFSSPPIPEEPESPPETTAEIIEQATRKPPGKYILPTPEALQNYETPLEEPPLTGSHYNGGPVMEKGFIPSFGPPTKHPFNPVKGRIAHSNHLHRLAKIKTLQTTSPVPVLRPEYPSEENSIAEEEVEEVTESIESPIPKGKVYKHISIHVPPQDLEDDISAPKIVKVAKNPDKHLKLIFIKPPEESSQKTLVEVPPNPTQKTLVYLLSESGGTRQPIKLVTPTPLKPAPPQVFFLRYTDPQKHPEAAPASPEREHLAPSGRRKPVRPIKQLLSPGDPDAELLQPRKPEVTSNPFATSLAQLKSTFTPPTTLYSLTSNGFETTNAINDPTNSKFQGSYPTSPTTNNNYPDIITANVNNAFYNPRGYSYSSLYHLYPPPALASNAYSPTNIFQQLLSHPVHQRQFLDSSPSPAKLQGGRSSLKDIYKVSPYLKKLNFMQDYPDGSPRNTRDYAMMTYAPTYMPSASGSDLIPVFTHTSPADFIKSLLGDSYHFGNKTFQASDKDNFKTTTTTTTSTTTTPSPPSSPPPQTQAQHHTIPLILHNNGRSNPPKPLTIYISRDGSSYEINKDSDAFHPSPATPVNPHLQPNFQISPKTTPQPQKWFQSTFPPIPVTSLTPKTIMNVPIIIHESETGKNSRFLPNRLTPGEMVSIDPVLRTTSVNSSEDYLNQSDYGRYGYSEEQNSIEDELNYNMTTFQSDKIISTSPPPPSNTSNTSTTPSPSKNSTIEIVALPKGKNRKRVNPALVKPGRRLRKVKKPQKRSDILQMTKTNQTRQTIRKRQV